MSKQMLRILALVICVCMLSVVFCSCTNDGSKEENTTESQTEQQTEAPTDDGTPSQGNNNNDNGGNSNNGGNGGNGGDANSGDGTVTVEYDNITDGWTDGWH